MENQIVYLPIEYDSREFDSKLLLACSLLEKNMTVVIGQQWMIYANFDRLPPGVVLFKSANMIHHPAMQEARRQGLVAISFEEESLAHTNEDVLEKFFTRSLFDSADAVFCVGEFEAGVIRKKAPANFPIHVVGNGRIELLKPQYRKYFAGEIEKVNRKYGDFILVNTNFTLINSAWQDRKTIEDIEIRSGTLDPSDPASVARWEEHFKFEELNYQLTVELVKELSSKYPYRQIIVRPHPGEHLQRWDGMFENVKNVQVLREGSHVHWTLACKMLIHTSCTTGFEAFVAGCQIVSLTPFETPYSQSMLINRVTSAQQTKERALTTVERLLAGDSVTRELNTELHRQIENYVWNFAENNSCTETVYVLQGYLRPAKEVRPELLRHLQRSENIDRKINISPHEFAGRLEKMMNILQLRISVDLSVLGNSLFQLSVIK